MGGMMKSGVAEKIKAVFDGLQDDVSRKIFFQRLGYYLNGDVARLDEMVLDRFYEKDSVYPQTSDLARRLTELAEKSGEPGFRPVVLYGAGAMGPFIARLFKRIGIPIECVCDRNIQLQGGFMGEFPVLAPEEIADRYRDRDVVVTTFGRFFEDIRVFLMKSGFSPDQIYHFREDDAYFGHLSPVPNEVYIDAGAFNGDTVLQFVRWCGGTYQKIYALEPDSGNWIQLKKNTAHIKRLEIIPQGAWNEEDVLFFGSNTDSNMLRIQEKETEQSISVTAIDSFVGNDQVTLIKMDIEGAELNALRGARETIRRYKPRLAICIYHKPEDVLTIPLYVLELNPDYRLRIRHHSLSYSETVLYVE
jgi:FkbM family methyltransferase